MTTLTVKFLLLHIAATILESSDNTPLGHTKAHEDISNLHRQLSGLAQATAADDDLKSMRVNGGAIIEVTHVDAKSNIDLPHQNTTGTGVMGYSSIGCNGAAKYRTEGMNTFLLDSTASNGDTNTIANDLLMDSILDGAPPLVKVLLFDCCITNRTGAIAQGISQFYVDSGLCKLCIIIFLQRNHSKAIADRK